MLDELGKECIMKIGLLQSSAFTLRMSDILSLFFIIIFLFNFYLKHLNYLQHNKDITDKL